MENLNKIMKSTVKYWWTGLLVGAFAIFLGFWSIMTPLSTLVALNIIFIAGFLVSGVFDISYAISMRKENPDWGIILASGLINLLIGFLLLSSKVESFVVLLLYVGFWVMFHAIATIAMSIRMQKMKASGWGFMLLFGILGVILSFLLIANFGFASSFIVTLFSFSLILYGVSRIFHAFSLRKLKDAMS